MELQNSPEIQQASPSHEWISTATTTVKKSFPIAFMVISCIIGILLVYKANKNTEMMTVSSYLMYFIGMILMLPSLVLFFTLYQYLLRPKKQFVFQEPSESEHIEQA